MRTLHPVSTTEHELDALGVDALEAEIARARAQLDERDAA
jgi:hypothetical protein